jgi:hypothetical protein
MLQPQDLDDAFGVLRRLNPVAAVRMGVESLRLIDPPWREWAADRSPDHVELAESTRATITKLIAGRSLLRTIRQSPTAQTLAKRALNRAHAAHRIAEADHSLSGSAACFVCTTCANLLLCMLPGEHTVENLCYAVSGACAAYIAFSGVAYSDDPDGVRGAVIEGRFIGEWWNACASL